VLCVCVCVCVCVTAELTTPPAATMTGSELLTMFGRLRGIEESVLPRLVREMVAKLDLGKHCDFPSETYR
jgi:ABC-type multidrug transport system ATPase subunit